MNTQTEPQVTEFEETILSIMRRLPAERWPALIEFARFLEFQAEQAASTTVEQVENSEGDARWDELLARPKAKLLLREMAQEARAEYAAGETTEIGLTDDGLLEPK
ncbi:MAG: hypothetical protein H6658_18825 [Ardenticatenaceae bacterium]|nr:hypothetical protein [Ardenticatenaceae bacterium]